jgi:hypothetical protein
VLVPVLAFAPPSSTSVTDAVVLVLEIEDAGCVETETETEAEAEAEAEAGWDEGDTADIVAAKGVLLRPPLDLLR